MAATPSGSPTSVKTEEQQGPGQQKGGGEEKENSGGGGNKEGEEEEEEHGGRGVGGVEELAALDKAVQEAEAYGWVPPHVRAGW